MKQKVKLTAIDPKTQKPIAQVFLNGYNIQAGGPLGSAGPMRSFEIIRGSLYDYWAHQLPIMLKHDSGLQVYVRVAALPVEQGDMGLFEALGKTGNNTDAPGRQEVLLEVK